MDILEEIMDGIKHIERLMVIKHRKSPHWKRRKSRMILAASEASLALQGDHEDNQGACEGSLENMICHEEPTSGNGSSKTLEDALGMPQLSISKSSTERTSNVKDMRSDR